MTDFRAVLTAARKNRGISRSALAAKIGCSRSGLRGWETGVAPSVDNVQAWANALGFDVELSPRDEL